MLQQVIRVVERPITEVTTKQIEQSVASGSPRSLIDVNVTPEIAKCLLRYNAPGESNRKVSRAGVLTTNVALLNQRWENTGEPIIMSSEGILNDGQHRLTSVVETGIPAIMDLRFGIARHAFGATNSGGKRTSAQVLTMMGVPSANVTAAILRMVISYIDGLPAAMYNRVNNSRIVDLMERWPDDVAETVHKVMTLPVELRHASIGTLFFLAIRSANQAVVDEFHEGLAMGKGPVGDPPRRLREILLKSQESKGNYGNRAASLALGIIAWNAYRKGELVTKLEWHSDTVYPKVSRVRL
jgi:hypothetical protein